MSKSSQALDLDKKQIQDFTKFNQNTHNAAVTNSVGMALVYLYDYYFPVADKKLDAKEQAKQSEVQIDQAFEECIGQLKATSVDFKTGAADFEKTAAIDYIVRVTEQPLSILDKVTLSRLKDKNSKDLFNTNNFIQEDRIFPLKTVLVLIWKAINDDARYAHNYSFSTPEENLKAAKADRGERIKSVFNCLINIKNETVCHHGNRNELTFLLNKTYVGIDLIEIVSSTVKAIFNDEINRLFWEKYNDAKAQDKRLVLGKLYQWMQGEEGAAHEIVKYLDPNNKIVDKIKLLFVNNGCDPNDPNIGLDKVIKDTLDYALFFTCDPKKDKALDKINKIFNFIDDSKHPDRNTALAVMKKWIVDKYDLNNSEDNKKINTFYFLFTAHATLSNALPLLKLTGLMQDGFITLLEECNSAFLAIKKPADLKDQKGSGAFPALTDKLLESAKEMLEAEKKARSATFSDKIESFFALWTQAREEFGVTRQLQSLYSLLLSNVFKSKVTLADSNIKEFFKESKDHKGAIELTPNIINRLFLHAILNSSSWSEDFSRELKRVIAFVKGNFNQTAANFIATSLSNDSYPPALIQQLEYLASKYSVESKDEKAVVVQRPHKLFVLTPDECKSGSDWSNVLLSLEESLKERVYAARAQVINQAIYTSTVNQDPYDFLELFNHYFIYVVPRPHRLLFLNKFTSSFDRILTNKAQLLTILGALPEEQRGDFLNRFSLDFLCAIGLKVDNNYINGAVIAEIVNLLPGNRKSEFISEVLDYVQSPTTRSFFKGIDSLVPALKSLDYADRLAKANELMLSNINFFNSNNEQIDFTLLMCLNILDGPTPPDVDSKKQESDKLKILDWYFENKPIKDRQELKNILQYFSFENKLVVLKKYGNLVATSVEEKSFIRLPGKLIDENADNISPKSYLEMLLAIVQWDKRSYLLADLDFSIIKQKLGTDENVIIYMKAIGAEILSQQINTPKDLVAVLPFLSEKSQHQLIENKIKSFKFFPGHVGLDADQKGDWIQKRVANLESMLLALDRFPIAFKRKMFNNFIVNQLETFRDLHSLLFNLKKIKEIQRPSAGLDEKSRVAYDFVASVPDSKNLRAVDTKLDHKHIERGDAKKESIAADVKNPVSALADASFFDIFLHDLKQETASLILDWESFLLILNTLNSEEKRSLVEKFVNILPHFGNVSWANLPAQENLDRLIMLKDLGLFSRYQRVDRTFIAKHELPASKQSFEFFTSLDPDLFDQLINDSSDLIKLLQICPNDIKDEKGQKQPSLRLIERLPDLVFYKLAQSVESLIDLFGSRNLDQNIKKAIEERLLKVKIDERLLFDVKNIQHVPSVRAAVRHDIDPRYARPNEQAYQSYHPEPQFPPHEFDTYLVIYYDRGERGYAPYNYFDECKIDAKADTKVDEMLDALNEAAHHSVVFLTLNAAEHFIKNIPNQAAILKVNQPFLIKNNKITFLDEVAPASVQWHKAHSSISKAMYENENYDGSYFKNVKIISELKESIEELKMEKNKWIDTKLVVTKHEKLLNKLKKEYKISPDDSDDESDSEYVVNEREKLKKDPVALADFNRVLKVHREFAGKNPDLKLIENAIKNCDNKIGKKENELKTIEIKYKGGLDKMKRAKLIVSNEAKGLDCVNKIKTLLDKHLVYLKDRASKEQKEKSDEIDRFDSFGNSLDSGHHNFLESKKLSTTLANRVARHFLALEMSNLLKDDSKTACQRLDELSVFLETPVNERYPKKDYLNEIKKYPSDLLESGGNLGFIRYSTGKTFVVAMEKILKDFNQIFKNAGIERAAPLNKDEKSMPVKK